MILFVCVAGAGTEQRAAGVGALPGDPGWVALLLEVRRHSNAHTCPCAATAKFLE